MNRRELLCGAGADLLAAAALPGSPRPHSDRSTPHGRAHSTETPSMDLSAYEPRSMLAIPSTAVPRSRYPVIDFHTHLSWSTKSVNGVALEAERTFLETPEELLKVMDRTNLQSMVNLTGGYGSGLADGLRLYDQAHPDRFFTFTEPTFERFLDPRYPQLQADAIAEAHSSGARGLKLLKTLGLYLRDNITSGELIAVDDKRFDPMWDTCGELGMPVAIHVSDPIAFFQPTDRFNERFEELSHHPDWSFHGPGFPSNEALLQARNRVIARHPRTHFVVLHVGNFAENLANVSENLVQYPNMSVDIAARLGELGRQPRTARAFFDKHQDRILFGTDATPHGDEFPQQLFTDELYELYYRFLETDDEYFNYAPAKTPPQGRWQIYGIHLPDSILRKVYNENARRALHLSAS